MDLNGIFVLRASPAVGLGGMFATKHEDYGPIRAEPDIPPSLPRQSWRMVPVRNGEPLYHILFAGDQGGWGVRDGLEPMQPIIMTNKPVDLYIRPIDNGTPNAYTVELAFGPPGLRFLVGTEDNTLVIKPFPIGAPEGDQQYWQLTRIDKM